MSAAQLRIRPVTERDVSLVLVFIKELAQYEQMGDQVTATEDAVRTALFGPTPRAEAVLAVLGDTPVGFALFFAISLRFWRNRVSILRIFMCGLSFEGADMGAACWLTWLGWLGIRAAVESNGLCLIGTN